ncbi:MAG: glycosyltransferase family 2 protein, partial [Patescibacteria group bacterium]
MYWIIGYMAVGGNFAIKKDTIQKMGGFDTTIAFYGEDTNLARRASKFGKVKFKLCVIMHTSGRRFKGQGLWRTAITYMINFASEAFLHKPVTKKYKDFR